MSNAHDQVLSQADERHRISLCEYGLVHVEWGQHSLVYCPGDLIGLSYLLTAAKEPCDLECLRGAGCLFDRERGLVSLPYGSVRISLTVEECQQLHLAVQQAARQLHEMRQQGYFSKQKWLPAKPKRAGKIAKAPHLN